MADDEINFQDNSGEGYEGPQSVTDSEIEPDSDEGPQKPFPPAMLQMSDATRDSLLNWLDEWLLQLESSHNSKITEWAKEEEGYRAESLGPQTMPYAGANGDVVPAIAMAVDPIHARLDTGIFKSDPVFKIKPISEKMTELTDSLEKFTEYYQRHKIQLRRVTAPRTLELTKHGTMVLKVLYDKQEYPIKTYDKDWKVVRKTINRFQGPNIVGIPLQDFMFPPYYQHVQKCPIVAERQILTYGEIKKAETSGLLVNCEQIKNQIEQNRDALSNQQAESANHQMQIRKFDQYELWECWFDYDIDGDGVPESLVATYHRNTRTLLQLRYNYYFHQLKPYVVIPYAIANGTLYGTGIAQMTKPFQDTLTAWQRMAIDNAYLSNIRMWAVKKDAGITEGSLKMWAGRQLPFDDPQKDIRELKLSEIYPSSLAERQNLFGLAEKRTGVSDYLTGRESPIVGSRATATSTLALIQEGTRRVEEVLENLRNGLAEAMEMCYYLFIQYGTNDLEATVFGENSEVNEDIKNFFDTVKIEDIHGQLSFDLSATDAASNRSVQQQVQLAIIQVMMNYLEKLVETAQLAFQAANQLPELTSFIGEVVTSARKMFRDLLDKYDIRNPDAYLPDLEKYLAGISAAAPAGGQGGAVNGVPGGPPGQPGMGATPTAPTGPGVPASPFGPGGSEILNALATAGGGQGSVPGAPGAPGFGA